LELLDQIQDEQEHYAGVAELIAQVQAQIQVPCPRCGAMTPSGYKFCGKCGAAIQSWICWRCQSPVPEGRKFCGKCGASREAPAPVSCPQCGHENPPRRKFCGRCGHVLAQG
jgi:transposase-like protein